MDKFKAQLKVAIAILIVADVAIFGSWFAMWSQVPQDSRSWFYQTSYMEDVKVKDDFGDETVTRKQVDKFTPGLIDMALPASAGVTGLVAVWIVLVMRKAKQTA